MQRGNLVVEGLAALVEAPAAVAQQVLQQFGCDLAAILGEVGGILQQVEQAPAIAIGSSQENLEALFWQAQALFTQALLLAQRTLHQLAHGRLVQAFQDINAGARQQCVVQLEGGILGSGANKDQRAVFHIG